MKQWVSQWWEYCLATSLEGQVMRQCFFYLFAFYGSIPIGLVTSALAIHRIFNYPLTLVTLLAAPIQGFNNALIYFRPRAMAEVAEMRKRRSRRMAGDQQQRQPASSSAAETSSSAARRRFLKAHFFRRNSEEPPSSKHDFDDSAVIDEHEAVDGEAENEQLTSEISDWFGRQGEANNGTKSSNTD